MYKPKIYNIFPLACEDFADLVCKTNWASELGFDWVYLNPIHPVGGSGSLYAVSDHLALNICWFPDEWVDFETYCLAARKVGMKVIVDLVASHSASDSPLKFERSKMFLWNDGRVVHPGCKEADGSWTTWGDLAKHNWYIGNDDLFDYFHQVIEKFIKHGASGFRCDAAYQIPSDCWRKLLEPFKGKSQFLAETLGCSTQKTIDTYYAGFDYGFNSVAWWNGQEDWFQQQINQIRNAGVKTIGFPESHDTERVSSQSEWRGKNVLEEQWIKYERAFHNSDGILMPIGYEFMERRRLHVVKTTPDDICMIENDASKTLCNRIRDLNKKGG